MNLQSFFNDISKLNYVVMRNWEVLPPEGDIDLFVYHTDYFALREACRQHLDPQWYDIRTNGDSYYSPDIEFELLKSRREHNGMWIPNQKAHFLSLYYHNLVHKGDGRYDQKLKEIFWDWAEPRHPVDAGVGYHDIDSHRLA